MRATTRSTSNVSRATRAAMMLELSPLVTAATAPASRTPASSRVSRSKPKPTMRYPPKPLGNRRNASFFLSTMATVCPRRSSVPASSLPTRPHPTTTTCTLRSPLSPLPGRARRCYRRYLRADGVERRTGPMGVRGFVKRVGKSTEESDREKLRDFCDALGLTPIDELPVRTPVRFAGEITSLRIVPRAGAPAIEVTVTDGRGAAVAVFLGRARVRGLTPGRRMVVEGVPVQEGSEKHVYNPAYELLA